MRTMLAVTRAELRSMVGTLRLLLGRRLAQPPTQVGRRVRFGDGTTARVYRETVLTDAPVADPAGLVVRFRLRLVGRQRWAHALFRLESLLNTPLFAGHEGFRSKLWMADDERGFYRGVYQWDGGEAAETYFRTLRVVLMPWVVAGSVAHRVIPGASRDDLLDGRLPEAVDVPTGDDAWWVPVVPAPTGDGRLR